MDTPEAELVAKAAAGDSEALAALAVRTAPRLRGALAGAIPERWRSLLSIDDVLQQTWGDVVLGIGTFESRGEGSFAAWATTLARHNLLNAVRMLEAQKRGGRARRVGTAGSIDDSSCADLLELLCQEHNTPSRAAAGFEARAALMAAIEALPTDYATVVRGYDLEGREPEDVAAELGRSVGAMYMLRARAHRLLAATLGSASRLISDG